MSKEMQEILERLDDALSIALTDEKFKDIANDVYNVIIKYEEGGK